MHRAVQLIDPLASGHLMKPVDILGHDSVQLTRSLQLRQLPMGRIGLRLRAEQLFPVKPVELLRFPHEKLWLMMVSGGYFHS